ncbi:ATP-binding protein [Falsiroseomonas sp.]|uniref:ATP-binding protein n=1 Tax=Falsiroseomonas sp. TaxID=2870721 RepID=UPI003F6E81BB
MTELLRLADVFKSVGQPTVTYVKRDSGNLERKLRLALAQAGQLCLLTGPSKTGKTTLYREVLASRGEIPLIVQCDRHTKLEDVWLHALEGIDFERAESRQTTSSTKGSVEAELSLQLGWAWLAEKAARIKGTITGEKSESEVKRRILASPGPDLLIPALKHTNYVLVIEDFHYLSDEVKVVLFQQWKRFVDNEVSVLVLGTTHRAVDIANSNRDLVGRIAQFDVGSWAVEDLEKIISQGFDYLKIKITPQLKNFIAMESVGLPLVTQQICLEMLISEPAEYIDEVRGKAIAFDRATIGSSMHTVAKNRFTQFESYYSTLIKGPREGARKYKTYELVLACFTLDPIKFSLSRMEIDQRLGKLKLANSDIPPQASLNSTLGALKKFQERRGFELLEWRPAEDILYIIEPSFLFYVRWRTTKGATQKQLDLFEVLLSSTSEWLNLDLAKRVTVDHLPPNNNVKSLLGRKWKS